MTGTGLENLFIVCVAASLSFAFAGALAALGDWVAKKWGDDNE